MKENYLFDYINENEFKKLERSLKKYNMLAYKKLYFEYYPALKEGNLTKIMFPSFSKISPKWQQLI